MQPEISVIIPVWNGEASIRTCLESVLSQPVASMEVIVVDDGSTDGTWVLLQSMAEKDERLRILHQENAGVSAARNTALAHCRGRYIRFVDADDRLTPDSLDILLKKIRDNDSDLVLAAYTEVMMGQPFHRDLGQCEDTIGMDEFLRRLERLSNSFYYGVLWNKLFRGDIIRDQALRFDPRLVWGEDFSFVMDYLAHAGRISYTTAAVYEYHRNPKGAVMRQLSRCITHPIASLQDRLRIYHSYRRLYQRCGAYALYRRKLWLYLFRFTIRN